MATVIADDLKCCIDCLQYIANGTLPYPGFDSREERLNRRFARRIAKRNPRGVLVAACDEDCEGSFRPGPCDVCGNPLAGDFHKASILE